MMNMILNHMLREFRDNSNGRGPDSIELLEMCKALADELGLSKIMTSKSKGVTVA